MSKKHQQYFYAVLAFGLAAAIAGEQTPSCPARPNPGTVVSNPTEIISQDGVLNAGFTFLSSFDVHGYLNECYVYRTSPGPVEA
jgi:hypothetical protein